MTTTPDMVEKVARALHEQFQTESGWPVAWDDHKLGLQEQTCRSAVAAIQAHLKALEEAGFVVVPRELLGAGELARWYSGREPQADRETVE